MLVPSLTSNLQTTLPKYPTVEGADCSVVNGWQSKWPQKGSKENQHELAAVTVHCSLVLRSFQRSSVLVFSGNLHHLEVMDERTQMCEPAKKRNSCVIYTLFFLKSTSIIWKDPALWFRQRWSDQRKKKKNDECHRFLKVTACCPISLSYQSPGHSNYP